MIWRLGIVGVWVVRGSEVGLVDDDGRAGGRAGVEFVWHCWRALDILVYALSRASFAG